MLNKTLYYFPPNHYTKHLKQTQSAYFSYHSLYNRLLKTFPAEFLTLFFPVLYDEIDGAIIKHLHSEKVRISLEQQKMCVITFQVTIKSIDSLIVLYIVHDKEVAKDFNEDLYYINKYLSDKYEQTIIPVVLFTRGSGPKESLYCVNIGGINAIYFTYLALNIREVDWQLFENTNNPVLAAFLSVMTHKQSERIQLKLVFLRLLANLKLSKDKQNLLIYFFQANLQLTDDEEDELMKLIDEQHDADQIFEIINPYIERGKKLSVILGQEIKLKIAKKLLEKNFELEDIIEITNLSKEELVKLKEEM